MVAGRVMGEDAVRPQHTQDRNIRLVPRNKKSKTAQRVANVASTKTEVHDHH